MPAKTMFLFVPLALTMVSAHADPRGKDVFEQTCAACHLGGMGGAPGINDKKNWRRRLEQGKDVLVLHALEGIRAMPPKGGNPTLSDVQIQAAVEYMVSRARAVR